MDIPRKSLALAALLAVTSPAAAQPTDTKKGDADEMVCEKIHSIGSRVATKKVCATRAEWAARKSQDRETLQEIQRLQGRPCVSTVLGKGTGAGPAC